MCGILGSINLQGSGSYLDLIKHRGPDSSGSVELICGEHVISLHHRRLSIVDLSASGSQPMHSFDSNSWIVFNGEIYNHLSLRNKITSTNFAGHSDTETILNYFNSFGIEKSIQDLNGIFAFAYFNKDERCLYLARDRFGVKPLYYYFADEVLVFSSEIRPLKAMFRPGICEGSLLMSLTTRFNPAPLTIYNKIYKVQPGQLLKISLDQKLTCKESYFVSTPKTLGTIKGDHNKLVQTYGDLFIAAVESQLMADVEVGVFLSGGIDSALVAAIAQQKSRKKIKAFTVGFEGLHSGVDEINLARKSAEVIGLEHVANYYIGASSEIDIRFNCTPFTNFHKSFDCRYP